MTASLTAWGCRDDRLTPAFDGTRAFALLIRQTDMGPRDPGSPGWARFQDMMKSFFDSLEIEAETQTFIYPDYLSGDTLTLVNWIARINPSSDDRVLIGAHYDSRPRADYDPDTALRDDPIIGANDGASGAAVLLHLAELMTAAPPPVGVDLVFFDGEDYGPAGRNNQYLLGSTHFASRPKPAYRFGIVIDMIGDRDLKIYRESLSERYAKEVNDQVWAAAARLGVGQFVDSVKHEILDDHLPLISAGIPAVDIIDFDYPYWHMQADTPDKCDAASLSAVGQVLLEIIYGK
jgi:glutaminyl-peptide cyclotransferase